MADLQHIIDELREAHDDIGRRIAALQAERQSVQAVLAALGIDRGVSPLVLDGMPTTSTTAGSSYQIKAVSATTVADIAEKVTAKPKSEMTRSEKMKAAAAEMVTCPECGVSLSKFGIMTHRRTKHGVDVQPSAEAMRKRRERAEKQESTPVPKAPATAANAMVLACSECDATFPRDKAADLSRHTITTHKRGPLAVERTPVTA